MDLRQFRCFVAVVDRGTVSGAAGDLQLGQSAVSRHVHALEREVGAPLLQRWRGGMTPTEVGLALYEARASCPRHGQPNERRRDSSEPGVGRPRALFQSHRRCTRSSGSSKRSGNADVGQRAGQECRRQAVELSARCEYFQFAYVLVADLPQSGRVGDDRPD